jgi:hypothetical protein
MSLFHLGSAISRVPGPNKLLRGGRLTILQTIRVERPNLAKTREKEATRLKGCVCTNMRRRYVLLSAAFLYIQGFLVLLTSSFSTPLCTTTKKRWWFFGMVRIPPITLLYFFRPRLLTIFRTEFSERVPSSWRLWL